MSVLVTGGAGYIGAHTCIALLENGIDIVVMDNFYNSKPECIKRIKEITQKDFKFYECDLLDKGGMREIFKNENIDAVMHFAGLKAVGESVSIPLKYFENNVSGSINLFEVMREFDCKKIVFSSSATVYGEKNPIPYSEDMPTGGCTNPYGTTKFMIEEILKSLYESDSSWEITILRYFNPIGAHESGKIGENPDGIPNNLMPYITQVSVGKLEYLNVYGNDYDTHDGTGVRDYIHVVDLANGHLKALNNIAKGVQVYNLGTGVGYSVLDVIKSYETQSGIKIPYKIVGRRQGDLPEYFADTKKAKAELGFQTELGLDRMCLDSYRWQKNNPNGM